MLHKRPRFPRPGRPRAHWHALRASQESVRTHAHAHHLTDASISPVAGCAHADAMPALRALCREQETLVMRHDELVTERNRVVQRKGPLADEHRQVLERADEPDELIDALNWTQSPASHTHDHHGQFLSGRSDRMARPPPMKGPTVS